MFKKILLLFIALAATALAGRAQIPTVDIHNRDSNTPLPLKRLISETVIEGPLARTHIEYVADNSANAKQIEAAVNLHVPKDTVLTAFGYYYGDRFIPGKMYDKGEAWKIYSAVTSRGRDPGIMDRPSEQDYHAQIFPVAPNRDVRVIVELVQMLATDRAGAHFELPIVQGMPYLQGWNSAPFSVEAKVTIHDHTVDELDYQFANKDGSAPANTGAPRNANDAPSAAPESGLALNEHADTDAGAALAFSGASSPTGNLLVTIHRKTDDVAKSVFSRMVGPREGFYALTITAPEALDSPRIAIKSHSGTGLSMPTRFGNVDAWGNLHIVGRYTNPGRLYVSILSKNAKPIRFPVDLSGERVTKDVEDPAGALWADKRITQLQNSSRRDFRPEIIRLSQRFMVVSNFTALLAIPKEELDYYKNVLAKEKIQTNTRSIGGGGGDPYISVQAPADSARVVAVFPDGDVKDLKWDGKLWSGRFDIPFGTPAGDYRVTVIVVHNDGHRSRFVLVYNNLLSAPPTGANLQTLMARVGSPVRVTVEAEGVERAVVVAPWGERVELSAGKGGWSGNVNVPTGWKPGKSALTVILLDGAHNRTEVTLDLDIR